MSIDLSQFHQVFFEESAEGLDIMESSLLELDTQAIDDETINAIFRAAHSIKGGSATFGFSAIAEFTHVLETLLDQVRSGTRGLSGDDVSLFLQSVDCMREMLHLIQAGDSGVTETSEQLKVRFNLMLAGEATEKRAEETVVTTDAEAMAAREPSQQTIDINNHPYWHIRFIPGIDILKSGNDVLRLLRELGDMGTLVSRADTNALPSLGLMDSERCYVSWDLQLKTLMPCSQDDIAAIFEWVADESELVITPCTSMDFDSELAVPEQNFWCIDFVPGMDILATGNDPVRFFSVLSDLGEIDVEANVSLLPRLDDLVPESCFLSWRILLTSACASRADIIDVFEWVLDESQLDIVQYDSRAAYEQRVLAKHEDIDTGVAVDSDVSGERDIVPSSTVTQTMNTEATPQVAARPVVKKVVAETSSIRVGIDKVDNLINMVGELVITQSMLGQLGTDFEPERIPKLLEGLSQLEQNTRELQESVMKIRMLPISFAFSRFPRMVRDLGQTLGKSVNLEMLGEHTELDKTVMEKIGDPLVHLVRNAVDHGIETPAEREAKGKPAQGLIKLNAYHQGGNVVIEIADDGKGLDRDKIIAKALQNNIISDIEAASLSDGQVFELIFQPGFSTAAQVSDVSGRGVGMDVVKRNIQALNGVVEISSEKDRGSLITIRLPLTLAILDGQLVRVGDNTYIFPLVSIVESMQCQQEFVSNVAGGCDVFRLRDEYVPIVELHRAFAIAPDSTTLEDSLLVVVEYDGEKVGIVVDELLAQQQVVIKSLEQNYQRVVGVSGATILGDGTVALILDIPGIVRLSGQVLSNNSTTVKAAIVAQEAALFNSVGPRLAG